MGTMDHDRVNELLDDREQLGQLIESKLAELQAVEPATGSATETLDRLEERLGAAKRVAAARGS